MRRYDNDARQDRISTPRSRAEDDPVISLPRVREIAHGPTRLGFQGHAQASEKSRRGFAITGAHWKVKKNLTRVRITAVQHASPADANMPQLARCAIRNAGPPDRMHRSVKALDPDASRGSHPQTNVHERNHPWRGCQPRALRAPAVRAVADGAREPSSVARFPRCLHRLSRGRARLHVPPPGRVSRHRAYRDQTRLRTRTRRAGTWQGGRSA